MSASGENDRGVLRVEAEYCAEPVRFRMLLLQIVRHSARTDERKHVDLARRQHARHHHLARGLDRIDHALWKCTAERFEQWREQQRAVLGRFEHDRVAHQQRRNQRGEGFVQRIVVRPHAQHDPERGTADLTDRAFDDDEPGVVVVEVLQRGDRLLDVVDGTVEFLFRVGETLPDLPHDQLGNRAPLRDHLPDEVLHALDALGDRHRRPFAATAVVCCDGRIQRRVALGFPHHRIAADLDLLQLVIGQSDADGREDSLALAVPASEFAIDEIGALVNRSGESVLGRNLAVAREQLFQGVSIHVGGRSSNPFHARLS